MRQIEGKKRPCFCVKDMRKRAGIGGRVRLDYLSVMEEGKWFYLTYTHTPCKSFTICYNLAPDELIIKMKYIDLIVFYKSYLALLSLFVCSLLGHK